MVQTLKYVYQQHGIRRGLYRGLSLNYIRCIPSQAVAFTTYELMKQFLHLNWFFLPEDFSVKLHYQSSNDIDD